jgi:tetratricopeptide (TPR) repeat protein
MTAASRPLIETIGNIGSGDLRRWKTLTAALKWSYGLLGVRAQRFIRAMAVFDGGWTEDAAQAIYSRCAEDDTPVIDHLHELLTQSLIVSTEANGLLRFRFLKPVRQAVEAQISPDERARLERAHAEYFLEMAERASPELLKAQQKDWLDKLMPEVDNFRAAFRWSVANVRPEHGLRLLAALWRFVEIRGYLTEGRKRAGEVLAIPGAEALPALLAKAMSGAGMLAYRQGDFEDARQMFERCLTIETDLGNEAGRANALNDLGNVANMQGDFTLARKRYRECLEIEERRGNDRAIAVAKFNLGWAAACIGDYRDAEDLLNESLREFRAGGNERESAFSLNGLAQVAIATSRLGLGEDYAQLSYDIREKIGETKGKADALRTLAWAAIEMGSLNEAMTRLVNSIHLARGVGDKRGMAETLELFGVAYARLGRYTRAVEALGAAEQVRHASTYALPPIRVQRREEARVAARKHLGELEFERAWTRGISLKIADAVDRAAKVETMEARH